MERGWGDGSVGKAAWPEAEPRSDTVEIENQLPKFILLIVPVCHPTIPHKISKYNLNF